MPRTLRYFWVTFATALVINLVMLAVLREDCDSNVFWTLLNLPGLPCGFLAVVLVPSEIAALLVTAVASCLFWGAMGAGVAWLTRGRPPDTEDHRRS